MSGTSTKRYVIKLHQNPDGSVGGYGVHNKQGLLLSAHRTLDQAERAMTKRMARDNQMTKMLGRAASVFIGAIK